MMVMVTHGENAPTVKPEDFTGLKAVIEAEFPNVPGLKVVNGPFGLAGITESTENIEAVFMSVGSTKRQEQIVKAIRDFADMNPETPLFMITSDEDAIIEVFEEAGVRKVAIRTVDTGDLEKDFKQIGEILGSNSNDPRSKQQHIA